MNKAKEKTALCTSVGTDERQSVQNTISSISALDTEINHPDENSPENFEDILRQMQRMSDPAYLHTVSMNELYETVYQSRSPVIDGLLYSGTYLFAGVPKVGKSFFMAQLAYHISTGQPLWNYEVHQGTVLYLALEDDYQRLQERMSRMFGVEGTITCILRYMQSSSAQDLMSSLKSSSGSIPIPGSLSSTPCRKSARSAPMLTAMPTIMTLWAG